VSAAVASSSFKCSAMQSRASRLSSVRRCIQCIHTLQALTFSLTSQEAAMVHNTPAFPILTSATQETVGPGAYSPTSRPKLPEDVNFIMMPQHVRCTSRLGAFPSSTSLTFCHFPLRWTASACPAPRSDLSRLASVASQWTRSPQRRTVRCPSPPKLSNGMQLQPLQLCKW
jgi:hypothetical protein